MKRLNPVTGKPFVRGDARADGFLFVKYRITKIRRNGTFKEEWCSTEKFNKRYPKRALRNEFNPIHLERARTMINSARKRATDKGGRVTIDLPWILSKLRAGVCEVSGLPFTLEKTGYSSRLLYVPSLDRIDSANPNYSPDNVQVVLWGVNCLKNQYQIEDLLPIMKAIIAKV